MLIVQLSAVTLVNSSDNTTLMIASLHTLGGVASVASVTGSGFTVTTILKSVPAQLPK